MKNGSWKYLQSNTDNILYQIVQNNIHKVTELEETRKFSICAR